MLHKCCPHIILGHFYFSAKCLNSDYMAHINFWTDSPLPQSWICNKFGIFPNFYQPLSSDAILNFSVPPNVNDILTHLSCVAA